MLHKRSSLGPMTYWRPIRSSVSPGVTLWRGWQQTVFRRLCPLLKDRQEASARDPQRGALKLQEAAHWHQVRIE